MGVIRSPLTSTGMILQVSFDFLMIQWEMLRLSVDLGGNSPRSVVSSTNCRRRWALYRRETETNSAAAKGPQQKRHLKKCWARDFEESQFPCFTVLYMFLRIFFGCFPEMCNLFNPNPNFLPIKWGKTLNNLDYDYDKLDFKRITGGDIVSYC